MILAGMLFRAHVDLGLMPGAGLFDLASEIRFGVLVLVLLRVGLSLTPSEIGMSGGFGLSMGTIPLFCEALSVAALAFWLLELPIVVAITLGVMISPISPAIVIPGLLDLHSEARGRQRRFVTGLLVGAPIDNIISVFAIGMAIDFAMTGQGGVEMLLKLPYRVGLGLASGGCVGWLIAKVLSKNPERMSRVYLHSSTLLFWALGYMLCIAGREADFSFVLAIVSMALVLAHRSNRVGQKLENALKGHWAWSQYALFTLIGAAVDSSQIAALGGVALLLLLAGQCARLIGTMIASSRSSLTISEQLGAYCAYVPKATIQAALGALPLDRGMDSGGLILSMAVLAITIMAPLGSISLVTGTRYLLRIPRDK